MTIKKHGTAHWTGTIKEGTGKVSTQSGALDAQPYGFNTRFEGKAGTNPEELIGAAHAACYAMAMSLGLGDAGFTAEDIDAKSVISLDQVEGGFAITGAHLTVTAKIPGIDQATFDKVAQATKEGCPVSKVLACEITMDAKLA